MMLYRYSTLFLLLGAGAFLKAQDLHFSQFYLYPLHYNPAQTGVLPGDFRASAIYRSQWTTVPVSYRTAGLAADMKIVQGRLSHFNAGLLLQHDRAGDAALTWTQVGLTVAAGRTIGPMQSVSAGLGLAFVQRGFDISKLKFKNQWSGDIFDPALPSGEAFNNRASGFSPTLSAGLHWQLAAPRSRTRVEAGAGLFHLNRPDVAFKDGPGQLLPVRIGLHVNSAVQVNEFLDLVVLGLVQRMGTASELIGGAGAKIWLEPRRVAVQASISARFGDALIPAVQIQRGNWAIGVSYDWNISAFDVATARRGGIEFAIVYQSIPVLPLKTFKSCPIF